MLPSAIYSVMASFSDHCTRTCVPDSASYLLPQSVSPGPVVTDMFSAELRATIPEEELDRILKARDVSRAVCFALSCPPDVEVGYGRTDAGRSQPRQAQPAASSDASG